MRDEVYLQAFNLSEDAEVEVYSISYDGEVCEFCYDLSFSACDGEMQYFESDDDGDFLQVLFTDVWDDDEQGDLKSGGLSHSDQVESDY